MTVSRTFVKTGGKCRPELGRQSSYSVYGSRDELLRRLAENDKENLVHLIDELMSDESATKGGCWNYQIGDT